MTTTYLFLALLLSCALSLRIEAESGHFIGGAVQRSAMSASNSAFIELNTEGRLILTVRAKDDGAHPIAFYMTSGYVGKLSVTVNGHTHSEVSITANVHKLQVDLRRGLNTIVLDHISGLVQLDYMEVSQAVPLTERGATLQYFEIEAEDSQHTGTLIGPSRKLYELPTEASGRKAVQITGEGYVQFKLTDKSNAVSIRFSIPDTTDGKGQIAKLHVTSGSGLDKTVEVSSIFSWAYGNYPFTKNPADGKAHHFYDEIRFHFGKELPAGSTVKVQGVTPGVTYTIDLASFYNAPDPYKKPSDAISVLDYNADNTGSKDSTKEIQKAIDDASAKGKTLWLDAGRYLVNARFVLNEVNVRGAGPWHTEVFTNVTYGIGFYAKRAEEGGSRDIGLYDFAITGHTNVRNDGQLDSGTGGAPSKSIFQNLWIEHTKCGMWLDGPFDGLHVVDTTMRNLYADGLNFHRGVTNSVVEQCNLRNLGDDGLAMWSDTQPDKNNSFQFNCIQLPVLANGLVVYGGEGNKMTDNIVYDTICDGAGIQVANRFQSVHLSGETLVSRNTVVRTGSFSRFDQSHSGGIWIWALEGNVMNVRIEYTDIIDSLYSGISIWNGNNQMSLKNVTIDKAAYVFEIYNNANAVVDVTDVTGTNISSVGINNCVQPTSLKFDYGIGNNFPNSTKCIPFGN